MRYLISIAILCCSVRAAPADSGSAADGSGSAAGSAVSPAPTPVPSSTLHDPASDPAGAISDVRAAKKSWPLLVLVVLIGVTKLLTYAGGVLAPLGKFLSTGKRAMLIAAIGTLAAVAYDALANGGSLVAAGSAVVGSLLALTSSHAPPTAVAKAAAT